MNGAAAALARGVKGVTLRFLLPLVVLGAALWGLEAALHAVGVQSDVRKVLRLGVIVLYVGVIACGRRARKTE